jgi:hypothetical protein
VHDNLSIKFTAALLCFRGFLASFFQSERNTGIYQQNYLSVNFTLSLRPALILTLKTLDPSDLKE